MVELVEFANINIMNPIALLSSYSNKISSNQSYQLSKLKNSSNWGWKNCKQKSKFKVGQKSISVLSKENSVKLKLLIFKA